MLRTENLDKLHTLDEKSYVNFLKEIDFFKSRINTLIEEDRKYLYSEESKFSEIEIRVQQYSIVVYILNKFFSYTVGGSYLEDKMGSCRDYDGNDGFHDWIIKFVNQVEKYMLDRYPSLSEISLGGADRVSHALCPYHSEDIGCTISSLKPMLCVGAPDGLLPLEYDKWAIKELIKKVLYECDYYDKGWERVDHFLDYSKLLLRELKSGKVCFDGEADYVPSYDLEEPINI